MKFKLPANVTADELFIKMQPVFISKYNWGIERGDNGELTILDKNINMMLILKKMEHLSSGGGCP